MAKSKTTSLLSQAHPALREHDGVSRIVRVVADRGGKSEAAGVEIDELAQIGHVLRGFVRDSGDVVLINEEGGGPFASAGHFLNVNHGAVSDPANAIEPGPPLPLEVFSGLRLAAEQKVGNGENGASHQNQSIKTK